MILTKRQCTDIEYHLFNAQEERLELARRQRDIIHGTPVRDEAGVHAGGPSDATGAAVVQLDRELADLDAWVSVVTAVFSHFRGTPKGSLLTARYVERSDIDVVCEQLYIARQTFYDWRNDILIYAALKASEKGIFSI